MLQKVTWAPAAKICLQQLSLLYAPSVPVFRVVNYFRYSLFHVTLVFLYSVRYPIARYISVCNGQLWSIFRVINFIIDSMEKLEVTDRNLSRKWSSFVVAKNQSYVKWTIDAITIVDAKLVSVIDRRVEARFAVS